MFHGALGYAVELGLLPANPIGLVRWRAPRAAAAVSPATVASPAQVRAILTQAARVKPELAAFFGCLYYAALRPEEAVTLRRADGRKTPSASGSKTPLTQAPASRIRHHARKRAVIRTVGTAPDPVAICTRTSPKSRAQPTQAGPGSPRSTTCRRPTHTGVSAVQKAFQS